MKNVCQYILLFLLIIVGDSLSVYAQSFVVKGVVSTSTTTVRYASVIFIDNSDTTRKFSAVTDTSGNYQLDVVVTSVRPNDHSAATFELEQNYPNPFSSSTSISYKLNKESDVKVTIYDILGREIKDFTIGFQAAGSHGVVWDGRNNFGKKATAGVYFYRLQARGETQVKKMVYGIGEGNVSVPLPNTLSSQTSEVKEQVDVPLYGGTFTVKVANTDSASPSIISQQFINVVVQSDTTLNFTVNSYVPPNPSIVYLDSTQQIIRGFGAANIVGWVKAAPDMTPAEVQTAFGVGPGQVGLTILRLRISPDSTQFSNNVPTAKLANSMGVTIIASPWTPPAWMKSNKSTIGGTLNTTAYAAYAAHLKAFADTMSNSGVPLYAISVQNEPDANVGYESCFWNATQFLNFMKNNAPSVGVPIFMPESEGFNQQFSDSTLNDSVAGGNVAFIGGHLYGTSPSPYPLAVSKGKELWMTEYLVTDTTWSAVLGTAKSINDCMNSNMSAYIWWYIIRYYGPINESGIVTKRGCVMSQYARFVRPEFYRVMATANPQANVYVTAYKNGSKVVIVALNMGSSSISQAFEILNGTTSIFTPYVTSSTKSCVQGGNISVSGGNFGATLDPSSVTTFVSN